MDAVSIATPDHWHAPATILACAAGKHVYVEKPGSHNLHESELMVAAARKYKRVVQMGNQRRSWPWVIESIEALHAGELGQVCFARGLVHQPPRLDRPRQTRAGAGLAGLLAVARARARAALPGQCHPLQLALVLELGHRRTRQQRRPLPRPRALGPAAWTCPGASPAAAIATSTRTTGRRRTPSCATFDFGDKGITWEGQSCAPRGFEGATVGVNFYGEKGCMAMAGNNTIIYDLNNKVVREIKSKRDGLFDFDAVHFAQLPGRHPRGQAAERGDRRGPEEHDALPPGQHRLAHRATRSTSIPRTRKIIGDKAATALCKREYRQGWEPKV